MSDIQYDLRAQVVDIVVESGDDLAITLTVTVDGVAKVWSGVTITAAISNGPMFSTSTPSNGSLVLSLTDEQLSALETGIIYKYTVRLTESGLTRTYFKGSLTVVGGA